jgi:hypothetical protein
MIYNGLHKHLQMVLNEQKCRFNPAKMVVDPAKRGISPTKKKTMFHQQVVVEPPKKMKVEMTLIFSS